MGMERKVPKQEHEVCWQLKEDEERKNSPVE